MKQTERRYYLIQELLKEHPDYSNFQIPQAEQEQKQLLRELFNIREPKIAHSEFLEIQDIYLKEEIQNKGITSVNDLTLIYPGIYLWKGDITTLECDAIVNAANRQMLGCFCPNHGCIDNAIHTYAGVQLRLACDSIMKQQGHEEETGKAKITSGYNLPAKYILHTVGPIIQWEVTGKEEELLASCYRECLKLAADTGAESVAFCCLSTGVFHFPQQRAAEIASETVKNYINEDSRIKKVIFNVFKDDDLRIYHALIG